MWLIRIAVFLKCVSEFHPFLLWICSLCFFSELEVQVPVEVVVKTKEDKWAVKLINLQHTVKAFCRGQRLAREVPVFGCPFGGNIFVFGIIDELRYDPDKHEVEISELKTRRSSHPPKKGQQEKDKYQVSRGG